MVGADSDAHWLDPVPLAVLPAGNIYREHAIDKLERIAATGRSTVSAPALSGCKQPPMPAWRSPCWAAAR